MKHTTIDELAQMLGDGFYPRRPRHAGVFSKSIHTIDKQIELHQRRDAEPTRRRKRELKEQLCAGRQQIAQSLSDNDAPATGRISAALCQL